MTSEPNIAASRIVFIPIQPDGILSADELTKLCWELDASADVMDFSEDVIHHLRSRQGEYALLILEQGDELNENSDFLKSLRADAAFDSLVVIIVATDISVDLETQLFALGANEVIKASKPLELRTQRIRSHLRTKQILDRARQSALERDLFAAGVLHDIRNIETALLASCEMMTINIGSGPQMNRDQLLADLSQLQETVRRMDDYATNIINHVRESNSKPTMEAVELDSVIAWSMQTVVSTRKDQLEIDLQIDPDLQPVLGDLNLMRMIFVNLLQNSIRYARTEEALKIHISQTLSPRQTIITKFVDNGRGVSPDNLRKIFQPFYREKTKSDRGFGIGLSMVSQVVARMRGNVWAELPGKQNVGLAICIELEAAEA